MSALKVQKIRPEVDSLREPTITQSLCFCGFVQKSEKLAGVPTV